MTSRRLFIFGFLSFLAVSLLLGASLSMLEFRPSFIVYVFILFTFVSYVSTTLHISGSYQKGLANLKPREIFISLAGPFIIGCIIIFSYTTWSSFTRSRQDKQDRTNAETYREAMGQFLKGIEFHTPQLFVTTDQKNRNTILLVKLPISIPNNPSSGLTKLDNNTGYYYGYSFSPQKIYNEQDVEDYIYTKSGCHTLNTYLMFEDQSHAGKLVWELPLKTNNPAIVFRIFLYGDQCTTQTVQNLIGDWFYVYGFKESLRDEKTIIAQFPIIQISQTNLYND